MGVKSESGMVVSSLRLWIPLLLALFVILGSIGLLLVFDRLQERDERNAFAELARVNAGFMERSRLPGTEQMAERLSEVIGAQVFFRDPQAGRVVGPPEVSLPAEVEGMELDGEVDLMSDGRMIVGVTDQTGMQMIFVKHKQSNGIMDLESDAWLALGVFWILSMGLGFGLSRWVTSPLQSLVKALPKVGAAEDLPSLPVKRHDEIGSLARVLEDTHQSLKDEREKRRQAERLAMLGRMATGVAHEIRNPAAAIRLHAELLDASDQQSLSKSRELILNESERLENLVSQWMLLSRPEAPKTSQMDLMALLRDVVETMGPQAAHMNVELELPQSDGVMLDADRHRLHQVFHNLLLNAIQAMPKGGRVTITVDEMDGRVVVCVSDEGEGFSESALERADEAFFSEREGGLGLGLAVAKEICEAHGGGLHLTNLDVGGACIRVELRTLSSQTEPSS